MKEWLVISLFIAMAAGTVVHLAIFSHQSNQLVLEVTDSFKERDRRLHELHTRLKEVEEQRNLERRLTDLERSLRVYCVDGKTAMCGGLKRLDDN